MNISIFVLDGCEHCELLKQLLKEKNINFKEIDIEKNEKMYEEFSESMQNEFVPAIVIDNKIALVPQDSFDTIQEAVELIEKHSNKLIL